MRPLLFKAIQASLTRPLLSFLTEEEAFQALVDPLLDADSLAHDFDLPPGPTHVSLDMVLLVNFVMFAQKALEVTNLYGHGRLFAQIFLKVGLTALLRRNSEAALEGS